MHPDCHQQLDLLSFPVGAGGVPAQVYVTNLGDGIDRLLGRPIIESEHCSAPGTLGDIFLVDLSKYLLIMKAIDKAVSIHVQFIAAENVFRFILQVNGFPMEHKAMTVKNSSLTRSSILALETRA
jgi:hypothetical protein